MKNFPKAGLLIVTLVIPALIFVFLKFFARNHYDLPYFNPEKDRAGKVVIANGDTLFRKVEANCSAVPNAYWENKLTVIHNLSKDCNDDCQVILTQLQRISALESEIGDLNILTLTSSVVPGKANLPEEIGKKGWRLLAVSEGTIDSCFFQDMSGKLKDIPDGVEERLILVDRKGFVRGYYNGSEESETDRLMAEIKILDYESKSSDQ